MTEQTQPVDIDEPEGKVFGVPYDFRGFTSAGVQMRIFQPEDPRVIVPRTMGVGWDINFGAVAVKLGLIRPDDSIPDLDRYIPLRMSKLVQSLPLAGAVATVGAAATFCNSTRQMPKKYSMTFKPQSFVSPREALQTPVLMSVAAAIWAYGSTYQAGRNPEGAQEGADIAVYAEAAGLQALTFLNVVAAERSASNPNRRSILSAAAIAAMPVVTGGIMVAVVKSALTNLQKSLQSGEGEAK